MLILCLNIPYSNAVQRRDGSRSDADQVVTLQRYTRVLYLVENCHYQGVALKA
jgi:hypothetical protein